MSPTLSIIVPSYNHVLSLPRLLDSVKAQTFTDYEVLIVDDCSDQHYEDVIKSYVNTGMNIRLLKNPSRLYTKETRLRGIEASQGELITFIDADDYLSGTKALEYHVEMIAKKNADLLHFGTAIYQNNKIDPKMHEWARPFAEELYGPDILQAYVGKELAGHSVWGKIATRKLWMKCMEPARAIPIRRYREDLLLCSLLFFHSSHYIGSERIGYHHDYDAKKEQKACGRAVAGYLLLRDFIPYIEENNADPGIIAGMEKFFYSTMQYYVLYFMAMASQNLEESHFDKILEEIAQHIEPVDFLRVIMRSQVFCVESR